ncbi:MAG: hypothetical protein QXV17_10010 [Candidatus Micrarchaeaceae archaeon]
MKPPSILGRISKKDGENLNAAIKSDKYWKVSEGKGLIFAVALDRARIPAFEGRYVKATGFGRVVARDQVAKFCRKYRILLVDTKRMEAVSVLTWNAFRRLIGKHGEHITTLVNQGKMPCYVNESNLNSVISQT